MREQIRDRIKLFVKEPFHPLLNNHPLKGKLGEYRSINITGDYRAVFLEPESSVALFVDVDTHHNLYKS
jgi:mRNA-degrading endonuclease YafQ of YafQ-DinJ toxin-antitoxin module